MSALIGIGRGALPQVGKLGNIISNLFKPAASGAGAGIISKVLPTGLKAATSGISKNLVISAGSGLAFTSLLSLTQGGQNIVTTSGKAVQNVTDVTKDVTGIIKSNPIIPLGLIALAGLLLIVVLKK